MSAPHASGAVPQRLTFAKRHDPVTAGHEAIKVKGWWRANRWLALRRLSQLGILALFLITALVGPIFGQWLVKGTLSSSLTLGVLPLTDPLLIAQSLAAGILPARDALLGAGIVIAFYLLVGGRVFCSWVCPVNIVSDAAGWLRRRLGIKGGRAPAAATRYWLLGGVLITSSFTGSMAWEFVNPVSMLHRGLLFGMGAGGFVVLGVFVYDLLIASRGWCGHLCPMGATYALLGRFTPLHVSATKRDSCDDCMDCFTVCPEPQVIRPALKGTGTPHILDPECTRCGRCADVCSLDVFGFTLSTTKTRTHTNAPKPL